MEQHVSFWTDPLRMTLIVAGLIVILAIVLFGMRPKRRGDSVEIEDDLHQDDEIEAVSTVKSKMKKVESEPIEDEDGFTVQVKPPRPRAEFEAEIRRSEAIERETDSVHVPEPREAVSERERFVVLHVVAPEGGAFPGSDLRRAIESAGMAFGERKIFHFPAHRPRGTAPDFSLANMVEPGYFEMAKMDDFSTSGVTLFMRLPGSRDGLSMFTHMLATCQILGRKLGGELWGETRQPLTPEKIGQLRSDAATFGPATAPATKEDKLQTA